MKKFLKTAAKYATSNKVLIPAALVVITAAVTMFVVEKKTEIEVFFEDSEGENA